MSVFGFLANVLARFDKVCPAVSFCDDGNVASVSHTILSFRKPELRTVVKTPRTEEAHENTIATRASFSVDTKLVFTIANKVIYHLDARDASVYFGQMKTEQKCKLSDLKKLNLKGMEILAITETSSDDISSITLRDTATGTEIRIGRNAYTEFSIHTEKPPIIEKRFFVRGKSGEAPMEIKFQTKEEAESFVSKNLLFEDLTITEVEERQ